jgi:hypothetical protein
MSREEPKTWDFHETEERRKIMKNALSRETKNIAVNPETEVTTMTRTFDVYTVAINVDKPTHKITLHTPSCKWWKKHMPTVRKGEKEELRDGGWIFYKSKSAATKYVKSHHPSYAVSKCRFCHKVEQVQAAKAA